MTEFHYGRFDLRFESLDGFMRGEDFSIVEINGIGGEAIDCWDPRLGVGEVYRRLADQQRLLFLIGRLQPRPRLPPDRCRRFHRQPDPAEPIDPPLPGLGLSG